MASINEKTMSDNKSHVRERLLKEHSPSEKGMWRIKGEDPNPDMGGPHIQPDLGTVSGTYAKVVEYALDQPMFIGWGYGGNIEKISGVVDVDVLDHAKVRILKREYSQLQSRMKEIEAELAKLTGL
jgi:hypothetical protein